MAVEATVVVPAYKEQGNLRALTERIFAALKKVGTDQKTEVVVVDDNSRDGSVELVEQLQKEGYNIRIIVRTTERGLSSAVLHGFDMAKGDSIICMDADLQHPPEKVPELIAALQKGAEFVIGTRYAPGVAIDKDWPLHRQVISKGARLLAIGLTPLTDPMTGFFGIRRDVYSAAVKRKEISAIGFKICMELYVKSQIKSHQEVPFAFGLRQAGESKLTGKVIVHYLLHLKDLYSYRYPLLLPFLLLLAVVFLYVAVKMLL